MNGLSKKSPRYLLLLIVASVHCVAVFAPLGYYAVRSLFAKKKDIPFRVKLGGFTPSHAPETGMPERTRSTGYHKCFIAKYRHYSTSMFSLFAMFFAAFLVSNTATAFAQTIS